MPTRQNRNNQPDKVSPLRPQRFSTRRYTASQATKSHLNIRPQNQFPDRQDTTKSNTQFHQLTNTQTIQSLRQEQPTTTTHHPRRHKSQATATNRTTQLPSINIYTQASPSSPIHNHAITSQVPIKRRPQMRKPIQRRRQ